MVDSELNFSDQRRRMVKEHLVARGITDAAVLRAMGSVCRERFVPTADRTFSYRDGPLPLDGATISQPYIVAFMTALARVGPGAKVLEIGTGSGYQAAVLAEVGAEVYTIEVLPHLATSARALLTDLGYDNIHFRQGDGWNGWPEEAPFDAIVVTAAPPTIPRRLADQLVEGGRLVIPVGLAPRQTLVVATHEGGALRKEEVAAVAFVPLVHPDADRDSEREMLP